MKNEKTTGQTPAVLRYLEMLKKGESIKRLKSNQSKGRRRAKAQLSSKPEDFESFKERVMSTFKDF